MSSKHSNRPSVTRHAEIFDSGKYQQLSYTIEIADGIIDDIDHEDLYDLYKSIDRYVLKPEDAKIPVYGARVIYNFPTSVSKKDLVKMLTEIELEIGIAPDYVAVEDKVMNYADYRNKKEV